MWPTNFWKNNFCFIWFLNPYKQIYFGFLYTAFITGNFHLINLIEIPYIKVPFSSHFEFLCFLEDLESIFFNNDSSLKRNWPHYQRKDLTITSVLFNLFIAWSRLIKYKHARKPSNAILITRSQLFNRRNPIRIA